MGQLKKLPPIAGRGGSAIARAFAWIKAALLRIAEGLKRFIAALSRFRVHAIAAGLVVLSFFAGYLIGLDKPSEVMDLPTPLEAQLDPLATAVSPQADTQSTESEATGSSAQIALPTSDTVAVTPLDGAVVSGPDWVRDPLSGDWVYSYDVLMESKTFGIVRAAMAGVVRSVISDGHTWDVRVDHGNGRVITYSELEEADVGPGIAVSRGQRIGLASNGYEGFRVRLRATLSGEPCSVLDFLE